MLKMINNLDRQQKMLCGLTVLTVICLLAMDYSGTPFVLATRTGATQTIPLIWIYPLVFLGLVVPFGLRNLGGLFSVLGAGLVAGGTLCSWIHASASGNGLDVSWAQSLLCVIVVVSGIVGISQMNVDFTDIGMDDLLN